MTINRSTWTYAASFKIIQCLGSADEHGIGRYNRVASLKFDAVALGPYKVDPNTSFSVVALNTPQKFRGDITPVKAIDFLPFIGV